MLRKTVLTIIAFMIWLTSVPASAGPVPKPVSKKPEAQKLIDQAWTVSRSDSNPEVYRQAIDFLEQANRLDPNNHTILTEYARQCWNYGNSLPKQTKAQQEKVVASYLKGLAAAEQSLKLKETAGNHYWLAVNKATSLEFSSIFSQAAAFPGLYSHSQKVKEIDRDYYYGAGGRFWTELLCRIPKKVVEIVGWDVQEAVDEIDHAIKVEPRYLDNYVYKARFMYTYFGDKEEALKLLTYALAMDPGCFPDEVVANRVAQREGRALWKKITGKEYPQK